ncbi:glycosyltransferase family 2 protein [Lapidilactobacillus wuchangensis]|uniref:glycosyltransferase family 2 protein n=1 Tax=Lapidilactobacillus wuchangensis TaxID=2486001 RepID=UPI000F7AC000|nr:glycosyltransferase family 2 protein [Lapidilactobacillus wuchangensis]
MNYIAILVSYNRLELLSEALNSLLKQTIPPKKVIVVDNHSTDGTNEYLEEIAKSDMKVVHLRLEKNLGGSGGYYCGLREAMKYKTDWISFSDDDAIFSSNYFELLLSHGVSKFPSVEAFSGTVTLENGEIQISHRKRVSNWIALTQTEVPVEEYLNDFQIDTFSFVGCFIKQQLANKIGLPKKDYFIWYDDTEYALRCREFTKIINISSAIVVHKTKIPTKKSAINWRRYYGIRNRILIQKKYSKNYTALKNVIIMQMLAVLIKDCIAPSRIGKRKYAMRQTLSGYFDGLNGIEGANERYLPNSK